MCEGLETEVPNGRKAILAGRLVPWKGGSLAIRAIAHTPDWTLVVIGSGPERRRLQALSVELGVRNRVTFVPWLAQRELWEAMIGADVLMLPSLRDDAPFIVGEAQALGLSVVAFEQGGLRELARLSGSTVVTVPLQTAEPARALADGLTFATEMPRHSRSEPYSVNSAAGFLTSAYTTARAK
jgi:glycosyltransferase involved in cell wall biosynthesis